MKITALILFFLFAMTGVASAEETTQYVPSSVEQTPTVTSAEPSTTAPVTSPTTTTPVTSRVETPVTSTSVSRETSQVTVTPSTTRTRASAVVPVREATSSQATVTSVEQVNAAPQAARDGLYDMLPAWVPAYDRPWIGVIAILAMIISGTLFVVVCERGRQA